MRRALLLGATLGAVNTGVVVLLDRTLRRRGDFGWYSYSPMPRRYADYLPADHVLNGWTALAVVACVLIAVNTAIVTAYVVIARRSKSAEAGSRL